jgi:hypothetical protein
LGETTIPMTMDGPGQRERTQETFGAAAPGRRVLYSASWVLYIAA